MGSSPSQPAPGPQPQPGTAVVARPTPLRALPAETALARAGLGPLARAPAKPVPHLQAVVPRATPKEPLPVPVPALAPPAPKAPSESSTARASGASRSPMEGDGLEPTVLFVGTGERFAPALEAALLRHHVLVESATLETVVDAVVTVAPDLVLVVGDAARDAGNGVLERLAVLPKNFVVPIVILSDDTTLDSKLRAFRHGATAIIPRTASVDATAGRVADLAREMPGPGSEALGQLGEATLEEFVATLERELRAGLEGVKGDANASADMRLVLGQGRPLAEFVNNFVRRVRRHVLRAEPLRYELEDRHEGGADGLGMPRAPARASADELFKLRVVLADDDTPRADAVAQELRARGATVVVTDLDPHDGRFQKLRQVDPTILMIGEGHVHGEGHSLLRRMRRDSRLRWASMLIVRWEDVWPDQAGAPAIDRFESTLAGLAEPERSLRERVNLGAPFDTRLEVIGPARCLRTLAASGRALRLTLENTRVEVTVDLSDGLVVGAQGRSLEAPGASFEGVHALSALLVVGSGRVRVEPAAQPASANIMSPVDVAITMADAETPPIRPSVPATGTVSIHPPFHAPSPEAPSPSLRPAPVLSVGPAPGASPRQPSSTAAWQPARAEPAPPQSFEPTSSVRTPLPVKMPVASPAPAIAAASSPAAALPSVAAVPWASGLAASAPPTPASDWMGPSANPTVPGPEWRQPTATGTELRSFVTRARAWFSRHERLLHAPRLAPATAGLLVLLGLAQVLLVLGLYAGAKALFSHPEAPVAVEPASVAPPAKAAAKPSTPSTPAPAPRASDAAPSASDAPPKAVQGRAPDGSGRKLPDCKTLLAADPPPNGYYPGAAWQETRAGRAAIVHGDLGAAQAAFCRAAHWDDRNGEIALQLAQVLLLGRDGPQALGWAERAVSLDARSLRNHEALADALARIGDEERARKEWLVAARIEPTDRRGVHGLVAREVKQADRALRGHELVVAEKYFRRAAILEPRSWSARVGLSYVLLQLGEAKPAVVWAERAAEVAPRSASVRLALGDALARAGDNEAATAAWREATLLDPNNREAQKRLRRGN